MTGHQTAVMWIGLLLLGAYLFTNTAFKNALFKSGAAPIKTQSLQKDLQRLQTSTGGTIIL